MEKPRFTSFVDLFLEIQVRIEPYIVEEELMNLEYSKFVEPIVNEVRHLRRMNSLQLTVKEDETVDA